jgi:hypothetical protein
MLSIWTLVVISIVCAALGMLIGGAGGNRLHKRRLLELEADVTSLNERLTREQKKRAGVTLQEGRRDNMAEAEAIAAQAKLATPKTFRMAGRANGAHLSE